MKEDIRDARVTSFEYGSLCTTAMVKIVCEGELARSVSATRDIADGKKMLEAIIRLLSDDHPKVEHVIFNPPATVLFRDDGEKTVVKCRECGDGKCVYDKSFDMPEFDGDVPTLVIDDLSQLEGVVSNVARYAFCQTHYDEEKAVMAAMLKRLHPNFQDVLRKASEGRDA